MAKKKPQIITIEIYPVHTKKGRCFSMRFCHANGKIANDKYTRRNTAVKMAQHFVDKIEFGHYRIKVSK